MSKFRTLIGASVVAGLAASMVFAGSHEGEFAGQIGARQGQMKLYALNLGQLGGMAKGMIPYDATMASAAASNLAALSSLNAAAMWPAGSDSVSTGSSRALPGLWENMADVGTKGMAMAAAADAMVTAAGTDLAALQAAMGPLGGACGACHKAYRQSQ